MNLPQPGDYIDIHTHGAKPAAGIFIIENLMAHEGILPGNIPGVAFSIGIHPWFLNENNQNQLITSIKASANHPCLIAIGEAGFDKLRGPSAELQQKVFEEQVSIAEEHLKPVIIHCVRAWDELLAVHKKLRPRMPWLIHGFRGNRELAKQLLSKGAYLSFWFDFIIRPESVNLLRSLPTERIFLETDGSEVNIRDIYEKVSKDLNITVDELKVVISDNFRKFFNLSSLSTTG
jgi:TatD DNase family protein